VLKNRIFDNSLNRSKIKTIVLTGLLFAAAIVLSIFENSIQLPIIAPGIKFGLSNIAVMFSLFYLGKNIAFLLVLMKAVFVLITRGAVAGFLSLSGGLLSVGIMTVLLIICKDKISYLLLSVSGAVFHNIGQLTAITIIYSDINLWIYLPVLMIAGIVSGIVTSTLLKVSLTAFNRLFKIKKY
jgi:heptaprenyl diphosphate synthase